MDTNPASCKRREAIRKSVLRMREKLTSAHEAYGIEFVLVVHDPVHDTTVHDVTCGLEDVWAGNDPMKYISTLYNHYLLRRRISTNAQRERAKWEPLAFKDIPGGLEVQKRVTWAALALAIPGKKKAFFSRTTTSDFKEMRCTATGLTYESWPEGVEFRNVEDMDLDEMEKVFNWCVKFVMAYDPLMMVRGLTRGQALRFTGNSHLSREGRYQLVSRLVQGALTGSPPPYLLHHHTFPSFFCISVVLVCSHFPFLSVPSSIIYYLLVQGQHRILNSPPFQRLSPLSPFQRPHPDLAYPKALSSIPTSTILTLQRSFHLLMGMRLCTISLCASLKVCMHVSTDWYKKGGMYVCMHVHDEW